MAKAHPEAKQNVALVEFHSRETGAVLGVNAFLVLVCGPCSCGGTKLVFIGNLDVCVAEDEYTTRLKLNRVRRPVKHNPVKHKPLAERLKLNEQN